MTDSRKQPANTTNIDKLPDLNRRKLFKFGLGLATVPVVGLVGCGGSSSGSNGNSNTSSTSTSTSNTNTTGNTGNTSSNTTTNGGQAPDGNRPEPPNGGGQGNPPSGGGGSTAQYCEYTTNTSGWATGGVKNLTASFPETAIFNNATTCAVTMEQKTLGPCFFAVETGEDIAGNKDGIPMQVCLQIVDSNCTPIANAQVEIWHCDRAGVYSADTSGSSESGSFAGNFCSGGNEEANNSKWFRGVLMTDGDGRVNFKTCFPGWYSGRTSHIHFRVKRNNQVSIISQFCFEDALTEEIYTKHPAYSCRGSQSTPLSSGDNVFGSMYQNYLMTTQKNSDNSMLAYKRVMLT